MGRVPVRRLPRRRRGGAGQPQRAPAHPVLPRADRARSAASFPPRAVVDGEIVIAGTDGLDFDALLQRIHPAASRVAMLAETTPASFVAFDLLALDDRDLRGEPFSARRALLEEALGRLRTRRCT